MARRGRDGRLTALFWRFAARAVIIDTIGMGLGLSIWGSANMLTGWSSAHFGVLWVAKETVPKPALNVAGALVAVVAIIVYAQVGFVATSETEGEGYRIC